MSHPMVDQFRFTRREWLRGLKNVTEEEGAVHFGQMNSISWTVGHLAWHEHRTFLQQAQNLILFPDINKTYGYGAPMSTPSLAEMIKMWSTVTKAADPFLDTLTTESLRTELLRNGKTVGQTVGSVLHRITYHYWYHIGETQAIRQMLGHKRLPVFVGNIDQQAPYKSE